MRSMIADTYTRVLHRLNTADNKRIGTNIGWLFFDRVLMMVASLFVGVWIARFLGPSDFGHLSYALALTAIFGSFAALGLDLVVVRELVKSPESRDSILGTALWLKVLGGLVATGSNIILASLLLPVPSQQFWLVVIVSSSLLARSIDVVDFFFQAQVRSKYSVIARSSSLVAVSLLKVTLIVTGAPLLAFGWAVLAEVMLASIGLSVAYRSYGLRMRHWVFQPRRARQLLRNGLPGIGAAASVMLYMKLDQVMLGELASATEVGNYAVSARLSEVTYFLPVIVTSTLMPSFVTLRNTDRQNYSRRLQNTYDFMFISSFLLMAPISLAAPQIVGFLYGSQYDLAGEILQIYAWSLVFISFSVTTGKWLYSEGLITFNLVLQGTGAICNVLLNLVLIPLAGGKGAAVATLISYGVASYLALLPFRPLRPAFARISKAIFLPARLVAAFLSPRGS